MIRSEIIDQFRTENPDITSRVVTNTVLNAWLKLGDKDFCAKTRCIVDQAGQTISTSENDTYWDLTSEITNFYDIDEYPGGGVLYNNKPLTKTTIAELDKDTNGKWRSYSSGTPKEYFRRGQYLYVERAIDSEEDDLIVYAVLISNDWNSDVAPYNQLTYLEPYHYGMVLWIQSKAKKKVGKGQQGIAAFAEYLEYTKWVRKELGGGKYGKIFLKPTRNMYRPGTYYSGSR